jgi:transcriptional regulator with XRE-family HTH domain
MKGFGNHLTTGQRVAYYRRRRGISQEVLAGLVGKTQSWVEKIEAGRMPLDVLSNITALARALDISVLELLPDDIAPIDKGFRGQSVPALRDLVLSYRFVNPRFAGVTAQPVELADLKAHVANIWNAYQSARFGFVVAELQRVLPIAFATTNVIIGMQRDAAQVQLGYLYQVAASVLTKLGEVDLAMLCADRGETAIHNVNDTAAQTSLQRSIAHALMANNQFYDALAVIEHSVSLAPSRTRTPELLSTVGTLHLVAAMASARQRNRNEATAHLAHAQNAAERLGADHNHLWTAFGPTNVAIHRVSVAAELGDFQVAVDQGATLDVSRMPLERQVRHRLEVARALHYRAKIDDAMRAVIGAESQAPEQVRRHFLTHALLHEWIRSKRTRATPELHGLAKRTGVLPD